MRHRLRPHQLVKFLAADEAELPVAEFFERAVADDRRHELFTRALTIAQDTALRDILELVNHGILVKDAAGGFIRASNGSSRRSGSDWYSRGMNLHRDDRYDEAIEAFKKNVKDHPASWNVYDSLAEGYATKGDKKLAVENYNKALSMAPESQKKRINDALAKLKT